MRLNAIKTYLTRQGLNWEKLPMSQSPCCCHGR